MGFSNDISIRQRHVRKCIRALRPYVNTKLTDKEKVRRWLTNETKYNRVLKNMQQLYFPLSVTRVCHIRVYETGLTVDCFCKEVVEAEKKERKKCTIIFSKVFLLSRKNDSHLCTQIKSTVNCLS